MAFKMEHSARVTITRADLELIIKEALGAGDRYGVFGGLQVFELTMGDDDESYLVVDLAPIPPAIEEAANG